MKIEELEEFVPRVDQEKPYIAVFSPVIEVFDSTQNRFGIIKLGSPVRDLHRELQARGMQDFGPQELEWVGRQIVNFQVDPIPKAARAWMHGVVVLIFSKEDHTSLGYIDATTHEIVIHPTRQERFDGLMRTSREVTIREE